MTTDDKPERKPYIPDLRHLVPHLDSVRPSAEQVAAETARRRGRKTKWWLKDEPLPPKQPPVGG